MKIKITYLPEEAREIGIDLAVLQLRHPGSKVRAGSCGSDQRQVYLKSYSLASRQLTPCDFCRHTSLISVSRKQCNGCPAEPVAAYLGL